jgi:hypothetical protein
MKEATPAGSVCRLSRRQKDAGPVLNGTAARNSVPNGLINRVALRSARRDESGYDERPDVRTRHRSIDVAASHCERLGTPP